MNWRYQQPQGIVMTGIEYLVKELRYAQMRGLKLSVEDVLTGLEWAMDEAGDRHGKPMPIHWEAATDKIESNCRRRVREEADRRFGQPHFGH